MRQAGKLEILNFIDILCRLHGEIEEAMENRSKKTVLQSRM